MRPPNFNAISIRRKGQVQLTVALWCNEWFNWLAITRSLQKLKLWFCNWAISIYHFVNILLGENLTFNIVPPLAWQCGWIIKLKCTQSNSFSQTHFHFRLLKSLQSAHLPATQTSNRRCLLSIFIYIQLINNGMKTREGSDQQIKQKVNVIYHLHPIASGHLLRLWVKVQPVK